MSALKEDLAELSSALPQVPEEVASLEQRARELADAASGLLHQVGDDRQALGVVLTGVHDTLSSFVVQVEALEKRIEASAGGVEKAWADGEGQLTAGEHALETTADQVNAARVDLMRALVEAGPRIDQAGAGGKAAIDRIEAASHDGQARIQAAAGAVKKQMGALRAILENTTTSLNEVDQELIQKVQTFITSEKEDIDALLDDVGSRVSDYETYLETVERQIVSETENIVVGVGTHLGDALSNPVGVTEEKLERALAELSTEATSQEATLAQLGDVFKHALEELKGTAAPLPAGIREIHEAFLKVAH